LIASGSVWCGRMWGSGMAKYEAKTKATAVSVEDFIAAVENDTRRADAETLLAMFETVTGWKAKMWGPTIVGFGRYDYTYDSGHSGSAPVVGFSPRKANLVIYPGITGEAREGLVAALGKAKANVSCVYINKLADVDEKALAKFIKAGVAGTKKKWPVSAE
jgi:hypothetical protein